MMPRTDPVLSTHLPGVTVVIPTRNRAYTLARVAESYYEQAYVNEIIVVDDGGTDDTQSVVADLAAAHPAIATRYFRHDTRQGASAGRITGYKNASNGYVLFGEDDAFLATGYVGTLLRKLETHPDIGIVSGRIIYLQPHETKAEALARFGIGFESKPYLDPYRFMFNTNAKLPGDFAVPFTHALLLTTKTLLETFSYDPFYARGNGFREETDFQINAFVHDRGIMVTNDTHCFHLHGSEVRRGGQRMGRFGQWYWNVFYTAYLYDKYYDRLRDRLGLEYSKNVAKLLFALTQCNQFFIQPLRKLPRAVYRKVLG